MAALWCSLQVAHGYCADGVASALRLLPDPATRRLLQRYGLLWLPARGGGQLFARDPALAAGLADEGPLLFLIGCDDAWFLNYTAIDQGPLSLQAGAGPQLGQASFYADNLDQAERFTPGFEASALVRQPPQFMWQAGAPLADALLEVRDRRGQIVWQWRTPAPAQSMFEIDLRGQADGAYTLLADGAAALEFFLYGGSAAHLWGALAVFAPAATHIVWPLAARQTIWRYQICSSRLDLSGWQVQGTPAPGTGLPPVAFSADGATGTPPCWSFTAQAPLALAERPAAYQFTLARPGARAGAGIRLPYARGDSPVQGDDPGLSEIFVFL